MGDHRAMADQPSCSVTAGKREGAAPVEAASTEEILLVASSGLFEFSNMLGAALLKLTDPSI